VNAQEILTTLVRGITERRRVQLAYRRKKLGGGSIHDVAPLDIRPGWTPNTAHELYLWAWCFPDDRPELRLIERITKATLLHESFSEEPLLRRWPLEGWPLPDAWEVPRDW
jgi:predicted DNA-binding transcriptional regulator YafY